MKKLILSGAVLLFTATAFAQTTNKSTGRFGLKAGVNLSKYHYKGFSNDNDLNNNVKDNVGFNLTGFGEFGVANNFSIQPGISLQNKGSKYETTLAGITTDNTMLVEVPVNAMLSVPTGDVGAFQLSAGPYIGFGISGKTKTESRGNNVSTSSERDIKFGNTTNDDLNGLDYGANFGLGYRLNSGVQFGANYGLGLANLIPKDSRSGNEKINQRVLGFSVGYSF